MSSTDTSSPSSDTDNAWTGTDLAAWVRQVSKTTSSLAMGRMRPLFRYCCSMVFFMRRRLAALMSEDEEDVPPSSVSYQSDGWSAIVSERNRESFGPVTIDRSGRVKKEFMLERTIVKTIDENGGIVARLLVTPARPMDEGQSGWHIFGAACDHLPLVRSMRYMGAIATIYLQDGLHYEGFFTSPSCTTPTLLQGRRFRGQR